LRSCATCTARTERTVERLEKPAACGLFHARIVLARPASLPVGTLLAAATPSRGPHCPRPFAGTVTSWSEGTPGSARVVRGGDAASARAPAGHSRLRSFAAESLTRETRETWAAADFRLSRPAAAAGSPGPVAAPA